jgi:hypothetical protein
VVLCRGHNVLAERCDPNGLAVLHSPSTAARGN